MATASSYTNAHRALLQSLMAHTTMTLPTARPILAAILSAHEQRPVLPNDITEADLLAHISSINLAISPYDLEIRSTLPQTGPRERLYCIVNTSPDILAQLATTHTPDELAFVARVLDEIFDRFNTPRAEIMAVTPAQALRVHRAAPRTSTASIPDGPDAPASNLTMRAAEAVLASLVDEGWLCMVRNSARGSPGYYTLSARALLELKTWLLATYNEPADDTGPGVERIKMCAACKDIVTSGQRCAERGCRGRLHDGCVGAMVRMQRGERVCPECRRPWTGDVFVGVRAAEGAGQARVSTAAAVDGSGDECEESEGEAGGRGETATPATTRHGDYDSG